MQHGKIVSVGQSNYEGTSKGMEGEGFRQCIDWTEKHGLLDLVTSFTADQDSSVWSVLTKEYPDIKYENDLMHVNRNFKKDLGNIMGKGALATRFKDKICRSFTRSVKESVKMFPDDTPAMIREFKIRMSYFSRHYFEGACEVGCWCTWARSVLFENADEQQESHLADLPCEMQEHIFGFLDRDSLVQVTSSCKLFFLVGRHMQKGRLKPIENPKKEWISRSDPKWKDAIEEVVQKLDNLAERAAEFVHPRTTCANENLWSARARDAPKDTYFSLTYRARSQLATLRRNLGGPAEVTRRVFARLGLKIGTTLEQSLRKRETRTRREKERKRSKEYNKRKSALLRMKKVRAEKEKQISKQRRDKYRSVKKKTLFPQKSTQSNVTAPSKKNISKSTQQGKGVLIESVEELERCSAKVLDEQTKLRNLYRTFKKDASTEGRRKRLLQYVADPIKYASYRRPMTKMRKVGHAKDVAEARSFPGSDLQAIQQ